MICPNCGTNNEDTYQFCMSCGTSLAGPTTTPSVKDVPPQDATPPRRPAGEVLSGFMRRKDLLKDKVTPADGEVSVRTYYCTYYKSRLLGMEASGYLGVTNKRVIFQALGTSNAGNSVIQSEVPIADVSGMSSYKGTYFSIGHLIMALFASFLAFTLMTAIVTALSIVNTLGALISSADVSIDALSAVNWLLAIMAFIFSFGLSRASIWKTVLATTSTVAFSIAGGGSLIGGISKSIFSLGQSQSSASGGLALLAFVLAFATGINALSCVFWYARRPTFSLAINSKGGSSTPIRISGASGIGLFDVSAGKALEADPAEDSEIMLQELGAVILDIQMLGDLGIKKWKA